MASPVPAALLAQAASAANESSADLEGAPSFEEIPKIDVHVHIFAEMPDAADDMQTNRIHAINICMGGTDSEELERQEKAVETLSRKYSRLFAFASTFDLTKRNEPDYAADVAAWLDDSFAAGAVMTKSWKDIGMKITRPDGTYILPDDPLFDSVYRHLANRRKPLMAHWADTKGVWEPLDPNHMFHDYFAKTPEWYMYGKPEVPGYETLIAARDRVLRSNPGLTIIGAHMGCMEHDLAGLGKLLDRHPHFHVDCSARTMLLSRMPRAIVRGFFLEYADRILYGSDFMPMSEEALAASEIAQHVQWKIGNYRREYAYYAGAGTVNYWGADVPCLVLPRSVLEKLYFRNALRLIPGLAKRFGFEER